MVSPLHEGGCCLIFTHLEAGQESEPFKDLQDSLLSRLLIADPCLLLQAPRAQVLVAWTHSSWGDR